MAAFGLWETVILVLLYCGESVALYAHWFLPCLTALMSSGSDFSDTDSEQADERTSLMSGHVSDSGRRPVSPQESSIQGNSPTQRNYQSNVSLNVLSPLHNLHLSTVLTDFWIELVSLHSCLFLMGPVIYNFSILEDLVKSQSNYECDWLATSIWTVSAHLS